MGVSAPADRRFKRSRVRAGGGRRLWVGRVMSGVKTILLVAGLGSLGYYVVARAMESSVLRLREVRVTGTQRLDTQDVVSMLVEFRGTSLLFLNLDAVRERLLSSAWIREVDVRRVLPNALDIQIEERVPVGLGRLTEGLYLVDGNGRVIDQYGPTYSDLNLPIINGLGEVSRATHEVDPERAGLAAAFLRSLEKEPSLAARVAQVDVSDVHDAVAMLDNDPALLHLGEERFLERLQSYVELAPALLNQVPEIDYIDLRFEQRIYLRPRSGERTIRRPAVRVTSTATAERTP